MLLEVMKMKHATGTRHIVFSLKMLTTPKRQKNGEDDLEDAVLDYQTWWFSTWFSSYPFNFRTNKKHMHLSNLSYICIYTVYICGYHCISCISWYIISSYPINSSIYIPMKPGQWLQPVAPQLGSQFKAQDLNWSRVGHRGKNNGDEKHENLETNMENCTLWAEKKWKTMGKHGKTWRNMGKTTRTARKMGKPYFLGITYRKHLETDKQRLGIRKNCFFAPVCRSFFAHVIGWKSCGRRIW